MITSIERLTVVKHADSVAVKTWRDKARVQAMSALSLANHPEFAVWCVRNSQGTMLGVAACQMQEKSVKLVHLATRDPGQGIGSILCDEIADYAAENKLPVSTTAEPAAAGFYRRLGWRQVGKDFWSK